MKKTIAIALFLLVAFTASAQIRGTYWNEKITDFCNDKLLSTTQAGEFVAAREGARMLGQATEMWYYFDKSKLVAVAYEVEYTEQRESDLLDALGSYPNKIIWEKGSPDFGPLIEQIGRTDHLQMFVQEAYFYNKGTGKTVMDELDSYADKCNPGSKVIEARYEGSSEVFISINSYKPNTIMVVYVEHFQEY